uniref:Crp/Fnr family transcriptional regulator n=2 Tax=Peptostreptococcaceae TaxID=186804 RepID=UPI00272D210E
GRAKVYSLTTNGYKYLEHIYGEYELFGELEVFINKPTLSFVEALEPCEVLKIPKHSFLEWLKHDCDFSLYINIQLSQKMYDSCVNTKVNIVYPLKYKLLFFLFRFSSEHNLNTIHKDIVIEGIGSNIRSVNRIIKELSVDNIIEYNKGYIKIIDFNKLVKIINSYL